MELVGKPPKVVPVAVPPPREDASTVPTAFTFFAYRTKKRW